MASQMAILTRARILLRNQAKPISTFSFLSQEPQLAEPAHDTTPLPPNPASGSPLYHENWRSPIPVTDSQALMPVGIAGMAQANRAMWLSPTPNAAGLMNKLAELITEQKWSEVKGLFDYWVRSLDKNGKPNRPDVGLYNHYLRANLMTGASAGELLDLVRQMDDFAIVPNTASLNLVLKSMCQAGETDAAEMLLQRMLQSDDGPQPDDESYELVIGMLLMQDQIDAAVNYIGFALKSNCSLSTKVFSYCVRSCVSKKRLDTLVSIIERCKTTDQNRALYPSWNTCNYIADVAMQMDNSKLAFYALEFMDKWITRGEQARPPLHLAVDEGTVVSALATAGRTYSSTLVDAASVVLQHSLRRKKPPRPECYIGKICAHASLGNLDKALHTLSRFEVTYGSLTAEGEDLFSPFTSLHPLVVACSKKGFETLDSVYFELENMSRADPPHKSVAALNCIVLGCANIWDLDRAYQTFESISSSFGLNPDIHSYNALMYAFGKVKKTHEASNVLEHLVSLGLKPNSKSYALLVDAHLINRDIKAALSVIDDMVNAGFVPSKETLKKVRRRCVRELDFESDDKVDSLAKKFNIRMGTETRRGMLFSLDYGTEYAS